MKFHCLLPVRDEADVIAQCLRHALTWADAIYVFDTGSVDETWEIVQDFAARDKRVVPIRKEPVYFSRRACVDTYSMSHASACATAIGFYALMRMSFIMSFRRSS